jgi:hypothetical protein
MGLEDRPVSLLKSGKISPYPGTSADPNLDKPIRLT